MKADNEELRNVFFYEKGPSGSNSTNLGAFWATSIEPKLQDMICSVVAFDHLETFCLGDPTDFVTQTLGDTGFVTTQCLPMSVALNYTYKLDTRLIRPGSKRFAGIPEAASAFNTVTDSGYLAFMEALRVALKGEFFSGGVVAYRPVVVKRVKYVVEGHTPTRYAYRLPQTDEELVVGHVTEVLSNVRLSHQVSRGNGR
jgi:hypothetical protein